MKIFLMKSMMTSPEERDKRSRRRKRNIYAKELHENKLFKPQVKKPKTIEDIKKKITLKNIEEFDDESG